MPLTLGYALITIAVVLVCLNATSLYLAQKRVDAIADAAALAAADGFDLVLRDGVPRAVLHDGGVRAQAASIVDAHGRAARLVRAWTPDGVSARVTVSDTWHPVVFSVFVPAGEDAAEDEGFILAFVYDEARNGSDLVILDAASFSGPPAATIGLPQRVPFGFHGSWITDRG